MKKSGLAIIKSIILPTAILPAAGVSCSKQKEIIDGWKNFATTWNQYSNNFKSTIGKYTKATLDKKHNKYYGETITTSTVIYKEDSMSSGCIKLNTKTLHVLNLKLSFVEKLLHAAIEQGYEVRLINDKQKGIIGYMLLVLNNITKVMLWDSNLYLKCHLEYEPIGRIINTDILVASYN